MPYRLIRILAAPALVILLAGCGDRQWLKYVDAVLSGHKAEADVAALEYEAERAEATAGHPCPQWYDLAMQAGFTSEQWKEPLSRIMYRESMCNPNADNPDSTANGLVQIVVGTWRSSCPDIPYAPYNPTANLDCAFNIWRSSGWTPWATY
jgi:hypothetical protein